MSESDCDSDHRCCGFHRDSFAIHGGAGAPARPLASCGWSIHAFKRGICAVQGPGSNWASAVAHARSKIYGRARPWYASPPGPAPTMPQIIPKLFPPGETIGVSGAVAIMIQRPFADVGDTSLRSSPLTRFADSSLEKSQNPVRVGLSALPPFGLKVSIEAGSELRRFTKADSSYFRPSHLRLREPPSGRRCIGRPCARVHRNNRTIAQCV